MRDLESQLVIANKILAKEGILDGLGHISIRDPSEPDTFLMLKNIAPIRASEKDIIRMRVSGEVMGDPEEVVSERFIHSAIYSFREDVRAICHSHNEFVLMLTSMGEKIEPVFHLGCFVGEGVSYLETEKLGDSFLIHNLQLGEIVANTLGKNRILILKHHGSVIVASGIEELVAVSIYLVVNAKIQLGALMAGRKIKSISESIARREAEHTLLNPKVLRRVWDHFVEKHNLSK